MSLGAPRAELVEMDALADALDDSALQIATLVRSEREFSANASHQLRSPPTAIALRLELISESLDPDAAQEAQIALDELHDLDHRIDDLLHLARTGRIADPKRFDVAVLVRHHADHIRPRFEQLKRHLTVGGRKALDSFGTPGAVGQALEILMDNALAHGRGDVHVEVRMDADTVEIEVRDRGWIDDTDPATANPEAGHGVGFSSPTTCFAATVERSC